MVAGGGISRYAHFFFCPVIGDAHTDSSYDLGHIAAFVFRLADIAMRKALSLH